MCQDLLQQNVQKLKYCNCLIQMGQCKDLSMYYGVYYHTFPLAKVIIKLGKTSACSFGLISTGQSVLLLNVDLSTSPYPYLKVNPQFSCSTDSLLLYTFSQYFGYGLTFEVKIIYC